MTAANKAEATTSVLAQMTSGIMGVKAEKAKGLTPVGLEATSIKAPGAERDMDMFEKAPRHELWAFTEALRDLVRTGEKLLAVIPASNAGSVEAAVSPERAQQEAERAADAAHAKFEADLQAKAAAAQAATFAETTASLDAVEEEPAAPIIQVPETCPTHGADFLEQRTSRRGRDYAGCTACEWFQK